MNETSRLTIFDTQPALPQSTVDTIEQPPQQPATSNLPPWWWFVTAGAMALFLGLGLLQMLGLFARPLGFFLLGIAIATALAPLANFFNRFLPRTLAIVVIYLTLILIFALLGWIVLPALYIGIEQFVYALPTVVETVQQWLERGTPLDGTPFLDRLSGTLADVGDTSVDPALSPRLLFVKHGTSAFYLALCPDGGASRPGFCALLATGCAAHLPSTVASRYG